MVRQRMCSSSTQSSEQKFGEVSEWLKEHAWKVCIRQRIEGSNPSLTAKLKSPDGNIRAFLYMRFLIRPLLIISHAIHYLSNQILVAMYPFAIGIDANVRCDSDNLFFVQNIAQHLVLSTSFAIISHQ